MENSIELNDIADSLVIINKITIDKLFQLENGADCIALYLFYYKTAKWQKSNQIKANDLYVKKSLKWGRDKIRKTKETLKENGLIEIIQCRKDNKISGWYIKVNYLVSNETIEKSKIKIINNGDSNNTQNPQVAFPTSSIENTNALKVKEKCLNSLKVNALSEKQKIQEKFEKFYDTYPKKVSKENVRKWFEKNKPDDELFKQMMNALENHKNSKQWRDKQFIPYPSTWLNQKRWEDELESRDNYYKFDDTINIEEFMKSDTEFKISEDLDNYNFEDNDDTFI